MLSLVVYSIAIAVTAGFGYLWYKTTPAKGSGWAMFACVFIAVGMNSPADQVVSAIVYATLCVGFGLSWYFTRTREYSGWLLAVSILAALSMVDKLL